MILLNRELVSADVKPLRSVLFDLNVPVVGSQYKAYLEVLLTHDELLNGLADILI